MPGDEKEHEYWRLRKRVCATPGCKTKLRTGNTSDRCSKCERKKL
jgi:hypothetical protein